MKDLYESIEPIESASGKLVLQKIKAFLTGVFETEESLKRKILWVLCHAEQVIIAIKTQPFWR